MHYCLDVKNIFPVAVRKAHHHSGEYKFIFPVAMRLRETPVPIPNTKVKTQAADGTILETIWESRWLPELKKEFIPDKFF